MEACRSLARSTVLTLGYARLRALFGRLRAHTRAVRCDDDEGWSQFRDRYRRRQREAAAIKLALAVDQLSTTCAPASARDALVRSVAAGLREELEGGPPSLRRPGVVHAAGRGDAG